MDRSESERNSIPGGRQANSITAKCLSLTGKRKVGSEELVLSVSVDLEPALWIGVALIRN